MNGRPCLYAFGAKIRSAVGDALLTQFMTEFPCPNDVTHLSSTRRRQGDDVNKWRTRRARPVKLSLLFLFRNRLISARLKFYFCPFIYGIMSSMATSLAADKSVQITLIVACKIALKYTTFWQFFLELLLEFLAFLQVILSSFFPVCFKVVVACNLRGFCSNFLSFFCLNLARIQT